MNRALFFGIATFVALVGISLVGADKKASAGLFHRGCGCACAGACGGCGGGCSCAAPSCCAPACCAPAPAACGCAGSAAAPAADAATPPPAPGT